MSDNGSPTEAINAATRGLDSLPTGGLVEALLAEQRRAVDAIGPASGAIGNAVETIARALQSGGALHYFGAGTSGRLGVLDAAECPPTFGTPPELVQAHIAGGAAALTRAVEGAEDDALAGAAAARGLGERDVALGISAGGNAPFVVAAIAAARAQGAATIALTANAGSALGRAAAATIAIESGAEALSGSTRLGAGTVQKIVLGVITTAVMVRLGRVYDNLMVDVVATNDKLRRRALGLVERLAGVDAAHAGDLIDAAGGSVKVAVAMARLGIGAEAARERLDASGGFLREVLGER
jgi:N-acetylmuramic acid 6-phosphate etherase